jgi:cyclohexa-1,5-dienecarbonyl-CoA hydratase
MEFKNILFDKKEGIARLTLNRPPLNVLNIEMMNEINTALENLQTENLKLLVFQSQGKAFCAGVDVAEHTEEKVKEMIATFHKLFYLLNSVPAISMAIVDGVALGGGCELAIFCDIVIASERAKFGQPEIKVGVFAPVATVILPHLIGRNRTLEMLATGDPIDGKEAERIGLINKCFSIQDFDEKKKEFINKIASMSAPVLQIIKKATDKSLYLNAMQGIKEVETIYLNELMQLEDAHEGLQAFLEKRPPKWKDK